MDREVAKRLAPVIQAYAEGKTVQCLRVNGVWYDVECPNFSHSYEYRVKPEWDDLKKGDPCLVRNKTIYESLIAVFAGMTKQGKPLAFNKKVGEEAPIKTVWDECKPFKVE